MTQFDLFAASSSFSDMSGFIDTQRVAGIDEAGRGPLAGPVFAAAVILDPAHIIEGLNDSKVLTVRKREKLAVQIREQALACSVASASVAEIDELNILQASLLAMRRAYEALCMSADYILVDGNHLPAGLGVAAAAIVGGDARVPQIAAASILAKTERDADCLRLHESYPQYAFDRHKGYATALHLQRLKEFGPCAAHRRSFRPVREAGLQARG